MDGEGGAEWGMGCRCGVQDGTGTRTWDEGAGWRWGHGCGVQDGDGARTGDRDEDGGREMEVGMGTRTQDT